jgi:membrane-associated phospholipid phosphatase
MLRRPGVLLALACGCAIATVALWFAANDVAAGRELDAGLADDLYGLVPRSSYELLQGARSLADPLPIAVAAGALVALAWLRAGRRLALSTALVLLVGNVVTQLLQPALSGARHVDLGGTQLSGAGSWPSGHAAAAMLLALGAIVVAGPRLRAVTAFAGLGYAFCVGVALVALGHLPSDVLGAYLVATASTAAGGAAYAVLRRRAPATERGLGAGPARSPLAARRTRARRTRARRARRGRGARHRRRQGARHAA